MTDPPAPAAKARDADYRRNQLPAGVTMVQVKRRFAAIRVRSGRDVALRTEPDEPWAPLAIERITRAKRPWVLQLALADGSRMYLRPFLPGEAGLLDWGSRVGGIGDSETLGDDPVSAVIAVLTIAFYVLAAPFFIGANCRRTKAATRLRRQLLDEIRAT